MNFPTRQLSKLSGHTGPVHCATYSAGLGQYILSGGASRTIHLHNASNSNLVQSYSAHGYEVLDIAVTEDNSRFVSVGGDKQVFLWDVANARTIRRWTGHGGRVNCVGFGGEGGSVVASGSFDATVRLWDCKSQSTKPIMVLEESRDSVSSLDIVGHEIITGSVDGRMRVYDLRMGIIHIDVLGYPITSLSLTPSKTGILLSTLDSKILLLDKLNGNLLQTYAGHINKDYRIRSCLGMGDAYVLSGSEDGQIFIWDLLDGKVVRKLKAHEGKVASMVSFNGGRGGEWVSAGGDGTVAIWGV